MKKKKIILEIMEEPLKKYGFKYDENGLYKGSGTWEFTRVIDGITQGFFIQQSNFSKLLYLNIYTSLKPVGLRLGGPEFGGDMLKKRWIYETDLDFKNIITEYLDIIIKYGIDKLLEMSIIPKIIITKEMAEKLFLNHKELNKKFVEENNIFVEGDIKNKLIKWLELTGEIILKNKGSDFDEVKEIMIEAAAFLGEHVKKEVNGEWDLLKHPDYSWSVFIKWQKNVYDRGTFNPLGELLKLWKEGDIKLFKDRASFLLKDIL